ncbi:MAG: hypothetical protein M1837_006568 [Sclerophora amabilis]|nr:MAG: hypothetical protein M1837_006568 [Sclerophora amabilis]
MTSTTEAAGAGSAIPPGLANNQSQAEGRRGGRRGGRGGDTTSQQEGASRGGRRGENRGRGSGAGNNTGKRSGRPRNGPLEPAPPVPPPPDPGTKMTTSARLPQIATTSQSESEQVEGRDASEFPVEEVEAESNADYVVFTNDATKKYEDFKDENFAKSDDNLGIKYEKKEIFEDTVLLLRFNCPDSSCDIACLSWPDLHRHVKSTHHKVMCDLCTRNKKVFTHEHELFTMPELRKHDRFGDDNPGAVDQSGFKGHPECGFCHQRFYGDDELYTHCRDKHERCHICDRRNQGRQQQYYQDYNALEVHFRKDHFLCPDRECLEKKFVVFDSEIDLKAHQLEHHPNGLSKDARRDARRIDISGFEYRSQHQPDRGGRREGRGRGRGRDPNTEPLPSSTAQPMRRDELAYQRQMAIQSAQSVSTRSFGGQLTSGDAYAARAPSRGERASTETTTVTAPSPSRDNNSNNLPLLDSQSIADTNATPQQQARALHHAAVISRASTLLQNSTEKLTNFRSLVSSYRTSAITAPSLIDSLLALFRPVTSSTADIGKLVRELADIYESEAKRNDLLKAWNDWRAVNEDYPALPPGATHSSTSSGSSILSSGGARVLKLKRATAPSSRSKMGRHGSWGSAADAAEPFPAIGIATNRSDNKGNRSNGSSSTPWVALPSSNSSSSRPASRPPSRAPGTASSTQHPSPASVTSSKAPTNDAFPSLPSAAKPTSTIFGYGTGAVRRDGGGNQGSSSSGGNVWGSKTASGVETDSDAATASGGTGAKKKGGNSRAGKKQMLFHFG